MTIIAIIVTGKSQFGKISKVVNSPLRLVKIFLNEAERIISPPMRPVGVMHLIRIKLAIAPTA